MNKKWIGIGLVLAVVFLIGIGIGSSIHRPYKEIEQAIKEETLDLESLQFQFTYLQMLDQSKFCRVVEPVLRDSTKKYRIFLTRIQKLDKRKLEELEELKRKFTISQIRYWLLATKAKDLCKRNYTTIIYFYDQSNKSKKQRLILEDLKELYRERLLLFNIDSEVDEKMIEILEKKFSIKSYPSLVIDGKDVYRGFVQKNQLKKEIE